MAVSQDELSVTCFNNQSAVHIHAETERGSRKQGRIHISGEDPYIRGGSIYQGRIQKTGEDPYIRGGSIYQGRIQKTGEDPYRGASGEDP